MDADTMMLVLGGLVLAIITTKGRYGLFVRHRDIAIDFRPADPQRKDDVPERGSKSDPPP